MWYDNAGKDTDVILASKVVISRNIKGFPFPVKMNAQDRENVIELVKSAGAKQKMNFIRCEEMNGPAKEDMYKNNIMMLRVLAAVATAIFFMSINKSSHKFSYLIIFKLWTVYLTEPSSKIIMCDFLFAYLIPQSFYLKNHN